jgi:ABC-type transport system substrate-binding protein
VVEIRTIGSVVLALVLLIATPMRSVPMPKRGGVVVITFNNDLTTLDPQVGYDWQNWSAINSIFDRLMAYSRAPRSSHSCLGNAFISIRNRGLR